MKNAPVDILIAEDDDQVAYILTFMLEREGLKISLAHNGQEAKNFIEQNTPPRLALLDIMMPYIDGYQLVSLIRSKPDWENIPVVMLSSKTQEKDIVRALEAGANDYIAKPFQPGELVTRVKMLMKRAA